MSAIFKIDQPGAAPPVVGIWDRSSRNIQLDGVGGPVTFTAHDPAVSYLWELISEPPGPPTSIVGANLPACQVSFLKTGGYLMRLTVDAGIPATEDVSIRYVGIRLVNSNLPIPAFNEQDFDNSIAPFTGELGSSEKLTEFFKWLDAAVGTGLGDLPQTQTVYVDGGRTDVYVETGTFAFPFKTLQPAILLAQTLADAASGEACVHIRPWLYTEVDVILPANVHIDGEMGAELRPAVNGNGIIVVPGAFTTALGVTFIRGFNLAGRGLGNYGLKITDGGAPPPPHGLPTVAHFDGGIGGYDQACPVLVEAGAFYVTASGGTYGDNTNPYGIVVQPGGFAPPFGAFAMVGKWNVGACLSPFLIGPNGAVIASETSLTDDGSSPLTSYIEIDGGLAPDMSLFIGQNLRLQGSALSMVRGTRNSIVTLNSSEGGMAFFGGFQGDIFDFSGSVLNLAGGTYSTTEGHGLVLDGSMSPVHCECRDTDITADKYSDPLNSQVLWTRGAVTLKTFDTRFRADQQVDGRVISRFDHIGNNVQINGGMVEGGSTGGGPPATVIDILNGGVWLTGGCDVGTYQPNDIAINVALGASLFRGHANVRAGQIVIAGSEVPLTSTMANLVLGKFDARTKWTSRATLAEVAAEPFGYEHGSIVVVTGGAKPLVYINYGTNAIRDWRLLGSDYVRAQMEACGVVDIATVFPIVMPIPFTVTTYLDTPPYAFLPGGIFRLDEDGDYRLSYNLPFKTDSGLLAGTSVGARWEYSLDSGVSWSAITQTTTFDTVHGDNHDSGSLSLPSYEIFLAAGTWLRVVGFHTIPTGVIAPSLVNHNTSGITPPADPNPKNWAWARVERGSVGGSGGGARPAFITAVGNPNTLLIPGIAGDFYRDSFADILYICQANGTGNWRVL